MSTRFSFTLLLVCVALLLSGFEAEKPVIKKKKKSYTPAVKKVVPAKKYPESNYRIVIDKSDYEMQVFDEEGWLATYPVVFGNKTLADKKMEGDRMTPEGTFRISYKKYHKEWGC
ncbi:MAG: L,D-transpeptidase, partial [Chitinophagaceae bacterium]|nr:L,D-transpeptidase [Chitinophagaceae bacterium]